VALLAVGSQLPDLIDKPLAWTIALLPSGRSLGHSVLLGSVVVVAAAVAFRRFDLPAQPFAVGYCAHLLGDSVRPLLDGRFHDLGFLLWPVVLADTGGETKSGIIQYFLNARLEGTVAVDLALAAGVFLLWLADGSPGVRAVWDEIRSRVVPAPE